MIGKYLKDRSKFIAFAFMNIGIFSGVLFLYNIEVEVILYAILLIVTISFIIGIFDFKKYCTKNNLLKDIKENIDIEVDLLDIEGGLIEERYKEIIQKLYDENLELKTNFDKNNSEMIDYYTLWVHQIKTPISAMNLILQHSKASEKTELSGELFKIEEYVSMVLGYLRLSDGESDLVIGEYDLDIILKNSIKKYSRLFIRKKLTLNYKTVNLKILTDEKWLAFGIEQLISNSIKYTGAGGVSIYVEGSRLYIEDTGVGIDEEDLPRIFDKGFTGYNGRINKKSTGIGLYLAKEIFDKLGYKLEIESKVDSGTKAIITLNNEKFIDY
ncbi:sensor histidine kinase [uncultured Clostridium sp.]|jgi:signal transduction histidine kinase|uniref:sensor histidine kinase n=1 Tax=uncultured Clostridium sp. TaxID=59620 RepID=UPI0026343988|nr:sensor histidine kinase [uncultured Clostridium sp.]